jgi:hypothetical protein
MNQLLKKSLLLVFVLLGGNSIELSAHGHKKAHWSKKKLAAYVGLCKKYKHKLKKAKHAHHKHDPKKKKGHHKAHHSKKFGHGCKHGKHKKK